MTTVSPYNSGFKEKWSSDTNFFSEPDMNIIMMASVRGFRKLEKNLSQSQNVRRVLERINVGINEMKQKHDVNALSSSDISLLAQVVSHLNLYYKSGETDSFRLNQVTELTKSIPGLS